MMLNIEDIKDLAEFARKLKVKTLQIGDVKIEMSDYAFVEDISNQESQGKPAATSEEKDSPKLWADEREDLSQDEYDELLFHSSNS